MIRCAIRSTVACGIASIALLLVTSCPSDLNAATKTASARKPIRNPKFDPTAEQVDLFAAMESGHVTVKLIPKGASGGNVFIENKTDRPLTVKIPEVVAAASIHSQIGNLFGNQGFGNPGAGGGGGGNQAGGQQVLGGGIGQQGNGPGGANGPGAGQNPGNVPGFFSIPAEKTIALTFNSVCLEHGKVEPSANSKYTLVPVTRFSRDPVLHQLLTVVAAGKTEQKACQAAAWHVSNKISFQTLSEKTTTPLGSLTQTPDFTREQIQAAQDLVEEARKRASDAQASTTLESSPDATATASETVRVAKK